jgi:uncharacterized protein YndB with AHSA1/START domain
MASEPIVKEICIAAVPAEVFEHLTDPVKINRWMGIGAYTDPRPGGIYSVNVNGLDVARGEFIELLPESRVSFTWGWWQKGLSVPSGSTRVEFDLQPADKGTRVRMTHRDLPDAVRDTQDPWWTHYLSRLKTAAEGTLPGPDAMAHPSVSAHT